MIDFNHHLVEKCNFVSLQTLPATKTLSTGAAFICSICNYFAKTTSDMIHVTLF